MLKPGDYIVIANDNIEGTVKEITLSSVKIQNPDNSFNYIPTYSLISKPFTNSIGVNEAKTQRIKRAINIDMRTIRFCTDNLLKKLHDLELLKDFPDQKGAIFSKDSVSNKPQMLTNAGLYRKYIELYLKNYPGINKSFPFLVRQLQPVNNGLPIEVYIFIDEMNWVNYESIQAELFEHFIAIMREFELSPFQMQ